MLPNNHPYYPQDISLSGGVFTRNTLDAVGLVLAFAAGCTVILGSTVLIVGRVNPGLKLTDKALILWFVLSGTIHFFFEGYFSYNHHRMGSRMDLFGQLWKEYALSDSRYLTSDPFVLCMETITAVRTFESAPICLIDSDRYHGGLYRT